MKKLLLVAGILVLSTSLMGETAKDVKEDTVNVKAKVVAPLVLSTGDVDFGILVPGETKTEETKGKVKLVGTANENIKLEVKVTENGNYTNYAGQDKDYDVELKTGKGVEANEKMTSILNLVSTDVEGNVADGKVNLGADGVLEFDVTGTVNAAQNQKAGTYEGKFYVRAMYN